MRNQKGGGGGLGAFVVGVFIMVLFILFYFTAI